METLHAFVWVWAAGIPFSLSLSLFPIQSLMAHLNARGYKLLEGHSELKMEVIHSELW
jgi:hypothetical protein